LTPDEKKKMGAVWATKPLVLVDSFTISASLYLGGRDRGGADGIGFVIQNNGSMCLGRHGGGMGMGGISPSIGVEFDTFKNPLDTLVADHMAVVKDGRVFKSIIDGPYPFPGGQNVEDGIFHQVRFEWVNSTMTLKVYWEGNSTAISSTVIDLVATFGSESAYFGFTASTGQKSNQHEVCFASISGTVVETLAPSVQPTIAPSVAASFTPSFLLFTI
jgi:hypothetical protein